MLISLKNKLMAFKDIFKNNNEYNEKNIVGFLSFAMMVIFAIADIITGFMGKQLEIKDIIYNSFLYVTLGAFGISELSSVFGNNKNKKEDNDL